MVTFLLLGNECTTCWRPASGWSGGVTTPCGCGARNDVEAHDAMIRVARRRDELVRAQQRQSTAAADAAIEAHRNGQDRAELAPEAQAWLDIVSVLADLAQLARAGQR